MGPSSSMGSERYWLAVSRTRGLYSQRRELGRAAATCTAARI